MRGLEERLREVSVAAAVATAAAVPDKRLIEMLDKAVSGLLSPNGPIGDRLDRVQVTLEEAARAIGNLSCLRYRQSR